MCKKLNPTQRAAADRERLLGQALAMARSGFFVHDFRSGLLQADPSFLRMLGYEAGETATRIEHWIQQVHPDDRDLLAAEIAALQRERTRRIKLAVRLRNADGEDRWIEFVGEPHAEDEAGVHSMLVIGQDITIRKIAELAAAEAALRRRLLFEQSPDGIVLLDAEMKVADANPAFAGMLGYTPEELLGFHAWDWDVQWPTQEQFRRRWPRIPDTPGTIETLHRRKDGGIFPVEVAWQPTEWHSRALCYCICRDITERKRNEAQMLRLATIVEAASDLIATSDAMGRITYMNRSGRALLQIAPTEPLSKTHIRDYHPLWAYRIVAQQAIPAAVEHGVWLGDTAMRRRDDEEVPVSQLIIVHKRSDGQVDFMATIARDIRSRLETESRLRQADRRKDDFLAMLAHELRNPLAPICNAVEILKDTADTGPVLEWCREVIRRQTEHLAHLVDDLLEVFRIRHGKVELKRKPLEVAELLQRAVETNRQLIDARRLDLSVELPPDSLCIDGDLVRLVQVMSNLLNNAAKYTKTGGRIRLGAERNGSDAVIRVADTGQGIDPSVLPQLFDLFYQADRTLDRTGGGLGIGLSIVKNLVAMHGGTVQAFSAGPGRGSEFVVRLPLHTEPSGVSPAVPAEPLAKDAGLRILVVDDNRDSAESMAFLLRELGHETLIAHEGTEGLKLALSARPDVLLLDIGLPGLNGYELCRRARAGGLTGALILAVTGYADAGSLEQSRRAGFDAHLAKPVRLARLQDLVADYSRINARASPEDG